MICLYLRNLYDLAETAGHNVDPQILAAMSARMRRSVGFRNVLGWQHLCCYIVVISTDRKIRLVEKLLQRLHYLIAKPLPVTMSDYAIFAFVLRFGTGRQPGDRRPDAMGGAPALGALDQPRSGAGHLMAALSGAAGRHHFIHAVAHLVQLRG